jgi:hypothetical protein
MDPISAILSIGNTIIQKIFPDPAEAAKAQLALLKMQQDGELANIVAQTEINKIEAASGSIFVAGWRPFCGWVGGAGLAYAAIVEPLLRLIASLYGYTGSFPAIDTTITMQILFGLLGLGAMRSFDKVKGVESIEIKKK